MSSFIRLSKHVLAIAFGLFLAELIFRLAIPLGLTDYPQPDEQEIIHGYAKNQALLYELKPSMAKMVRGVEVSTNRWGMRDREYTLDKPKGTFRVAVVGDSVTFGEGIPVDKLYSERLEYLLNTESVDANVEVLNFSVVGYNSQQEQITIRDKVIRFKPDLIILGYCLNDDTSTDGLGELATEVAPWALGVRLNSTVVAYFRHKLERLRWPEPRDFRQSEQLIEYLGAIKAELGIQSIIVVFPFRFDDPQGYPHWAVHSRVKKLALESQLEVVDLGQLWRGANSDERAEYYLQGDDTHLSEKGMEEVANRLFSHIYNSLQ